MVHSSDSVIANSRISKENHAKYDFLIAVLLYFDSIVYPWCEKEEKL